MKTTKSPLLMVLHFIALLTTTQLTLPNVWATGRNLREEELQWNPRRLGNLFNARLSRNHQQGRMSVGPNLGVWSPTGTLQNNQPLWVSFSVDVNQHIPDRLDRGPEFDIPRGHYTVKCNVTQNTPANQDARYNGTLDIGQCIIREQGDGNAVVDNGIRDHLLSYLDLVSHGSSPQRTHFNIADLGQFQDRVAATEIDTRLPPPEPVSTRPTRLAQNAHPAANSPINNQRAMDTHDPESAFGLNGGAPAD